VARDGSFSLRDLPPGSYTLVARSSNRIVSTNASGDLRSQPAVTDASWASQTVVLDGRDLVDVTLHFQPAHRLTGRVRFQSTSAGKVAPPVQIRFVLTPIDEGSADGVRRVAQALGSMSSQVRPDGTFEVVGLVPGRYQVAAELSRADAANWWLRSLLHEGRDLLDEGAVIGPTPSIDVVAAFADAQPELVGTLTAPDGRPAAGYMVCVVPEDVRLRTSRRRVQRTRPDTAGQFRFNGLPPGVYWVLVFADLGQDESLIDSLVAAAAAEAGVKIELGEGQRLVQSLKIAR
jgi:hypothetical protein